MLILINLYDNGIFRGKNEKIFRLFKIYNIYILVLLI